MRSFLTALCLLLLPIVASSAETGPPAVGDRLVLGLSELINRAIACSPDIRALQSDVLSSRYELEQVKAGYYPRIDVTALAGPIDDAREPLVLNGRITDQSPGLTFGTIGIFGRLDLTATQPLYTFGKLSNRKEAALHGIRAKEFRIEDKKLQIALRMKELYYGMIVAKSGLDAADEAEDFFTEAEKRIKRLLEADSTEVKESDLYRIDAYRSEARRFRAEANKGYRTAYFAVKALIELPDGVDFDPADKLPGVRAEKPLPLEHFIRSAASDRPEFKQLDEAMAAREALVRAAISDRYPTFFTAVHASLAGAPGREKLDNPYIPDEFNHAYAGVVAGAKWNLDFGIGKAGVEKARAEYRKLLNARRSAEMNIPIQVAKSYQDHLEYAEAVELYRAAAVAARKWVVCAMADFDMGVGTADDMLRAIEKYSRNQGKYIESLFRYNLSLAELEAAAGMKTW